MEIRTQTGKLLDTSELPGNIEGLYCGKCGCRLGWYDTGISDAPVAYCDDCTADLGDDEDEDEEERENPAEDDGSGFEHTVSENW